MACSLVQMGVVHIMIRRKYRMEKMILTVPCLRVNCVNRNNRNVGFVPLMKRHMRHHGKARLISFPLMDKLKVLDCATALAQKLKLQFLLISCNTSPLRNLKEKLYRNPIRMGLSSYRLRIHSRWYRRKHLYPRIRQLTAWDMLLNTTILILFNRNTCRN